MKKEFLATERVKIGKNPHRLSDSGTIEVMNKIWKTASVHAIATALYIVGVAFFMYYGSRIRIGKNHEVLAPIALLLLFVTSAAITGFLIFGKPAQWYIDGKKKEAMSLLFSTLAVFSVITFIATTALVLLSHPAV